MLVVSEVLCVHVMMGQSAVQAYDPETSLLAQLG